MVVLFLVIELGLLMTFKILILLSMSTRGSQGGLANSTKLVADIFDASGFDIIIFETVGVGQVEIDVIEAADSVVVTLVPESGDDIQMMKGGLMEIADLFAINKSDRQGADRLYTSLNKTLELNDNDNWKPSITKTIATNGDGVELLYNNLLKHKEFLNSSDNRIQKINQRYIKTVKSYVSDILIDKFWTKEIDIVLDKQLKLEYNKRLSPFDIANQLIKKMSKDLEMTFLDHLEALEMGFYKVIFFNWHVYVWIIYLFK